jgi:hypothetical protein
MRSLPLLAFLVGTVAAQPTAPSLQNLIANSPFGSANQAAGATTPAGPLEFRGTFVDNGERFFSILDTGSRRAEWVSLNEPGRPFTVKSYDAEKESIVLDYQGRALDLKLHTARVAAAPMPAPAVANAAPQAPNGGAQVRPQPAGSTTEAQRLAQVAEEIRRRRALRQQAQQQQQQNSAAPSNVQPPVPNPPQPR